MPPLDMTIQVKNNLSTFLQLSNEIRENLLLTNAGNSHVDY